MSSENFNLCKCCHYSGSQKTEAESYTSVEHNLPKFHNNNMDNATAMLESNKIQALQNISEEGLIKICKLIQTMNSEIDILKNRINKKPVKIDFDCEDCIGSNFLTFLMVYTFALMFIGVMVYGSDIATT
ncbi:hypothetical protein DFJ63DRAFT_314778 [Scheffersomyces coipomensis]|uniref:uncharacterized protein n=1 Tax=Scheffersomyces coipomensis TaxID=1788519 RepID=UPI00315E02E7